ncbi:nicotinate-nucleotide diphosphorylase (carboxylating) [Halobacteriales archaeon QS_3_64_16]|nr:MAG: nicotinate-nucleotide diphosphorylase (carboxylating) [Halobacteriales archaeon QS_3_64_16]
MVVTDSQVERWLREDLGHHDVTNDLPGETTGRLLATESGTIAGTEAAEAVFTYLGVEVTDRRADGERVEEGKAVLHVEGGTRDVLRAERVAVNLLAHASGIATKTSEAVAAAREESDRVRVAGTRKTTPGLRGVEKRAIAAGGGDTHRLSLSHMVMVKDNQIAELGLEDAISSTREQASFATKVEVEVETPAEGRRAANCGADIVLFDNLSPEEVSEGVATLPEDVLAEASGGISIADVPAYARTGVDVISLGSLTHSAPALDLSFRTGE